ncbi:sensor histidine kinase [Microscilla marina]|uniref:histidine kinase n=1 Tax=Microscilla marina ATCC 23134 TaxID=313606 RepID=A1ZJ26_MICM2|nr:GAF domain-containing sensor histidine kinase [Microscilla marina]EAY29562.1 two-component hybrid sensor and regulator [Microscilla marina ATCC 23134]
MEAPTPHKNEKERLENLLSYYILDTFPEEDYDAITTIAAQICGTSISLISLIDDKRQWFKSRYGLAVPETPKEYAFCAHAINTPEAPMIINDSRKDQRFQDNPLVTGDPYVIFYAGIPLNTKEGFPLGTLCVIDEEPKELSEKQLKALQALSRQVIGLLELRKSKRELEDTNQRLAEANENLNKFVHVVAHDLKTPLNNITMIVDMLLIDQKMTEKQARYTNMIGKATGNLRHIIDRLLEYYKSDEIGKAKKVNLVLSELIDNLRSLLSMKAEINIQLHTVIHQLNTNQAVVEQVLLNLVTNAVKYNDKEVVEISITVTEDPAVYVFQVKDNGVGIAPENQEKIFEIFTTVSRQDRFGAQGSGIGLATVQKLVSSQGGVVNLVSEPGQGSTFSFTIKK